MKTITVFSKVNKLYITTFYVHNSATPEEIKLAVNYKTGIHTSWIDDNYFWDIRDDNGNIV